MNKIAIVGAGLIGRLTAWQLAKQGENVTLFDRDDGSAKQSAAYAAGGLLAPLSEALKCEANMLAMGFDALKLWPKLLAKLPTPVFFQDNGTLIVTHQQDSGDFNHFRRFIAENYSSYQQEFVNSCQLAELEPELAVKFQQGLYLPNEGQLDNRALLVALAQALNDANNLTWRTHCEVTAIKPHQVSYQNTTERFDLVIDCRGAGAAGKQADDLTDLRAVRGELFHFYAPEVKLNRPVRLTHPRYQLYIAPKPNHHYIIGATEIESASLGPMTVRSALELLSAVYSVHSGFAEAQILEQVSQCRPAFTNNQPQIRQQAGLIQVNGLFRHGYLLAPVVLAHVLATIKQKTQALTYPKLIISIDENSSKKTSQPIESTYE